ncbi:hypothetical protein, variant [Phialophora macrospora]|nr:hypothetical protein, variant [Phialophora macrospora]
MPSPKIDNPAAQLREVSAILSAAVETLASEWESLPSRDTADPDVQRDGSRSVSWAEHDAAKVIFAAMGSLESLVQEPHSRLLNLSMSYFIARALHIAVEHRIADLLARAGKDGVSGTSLARSTGIEEGKICRIMRALASHHIFQEVKDGCFANNHISQVLVDDAAFRANLVMKGQFQYTASDFLPKALANSAIVDGNDQKKTAFQEAVGTELSLFDWMNEMVAESDTDWRPRRLCQHIGEEENGDGQTSPSTQISSQNMVPRPEKQLFNLAMSGLGRGTEQYHVLDFPWKDLDDGARVVDVGGGIGSFCMQLHARHPGLCLVVQDRKPVISQAVSVWQAKHPSAIAEGKVTLAEHDFFRKNPVVGAEVYWLRHIV